MFLPVWVTGVVLLLNLVKLSSACGGSDTSGLEEQYAAMEKAQQDAAEAELKRWCYEYCATEWSQWTTCDAPCAGGKSTRERKDAEIKTCTDKGLECGKSTDQARNCNEGCPRGLPEKITGTNKSRCKCPKGWKGTCCTVELECPYDGRPDHGSVTGSPAKVGGVATYTCQQGYHLTGQADILCKESESSDGQKTSYWETAKPTCKQVMCGKPDVKSQSYLLNGEQTEFVAGEKAWFACHSGYELEGLETRECRTGSDGKGKWSGFSPNCKPISCPDPGTPLNGVRKGKSVTYDSILEFNCTAGYRLVGSQQVTCLASGVWLGNIPTCEEIKCEPPYVPEHGSVRIRRSVTSQEAIFDCEDGYVIEGEKTLQCKANGLWSDIEPECLAVDCNDPGTLENGNKDGNIYTYPWEVKFTCVPGYVLHGFNTTSCQKDGTWSNTMPECKACPENTYHDEGECKDCMDNSYTVTEASTTIEQCICDYGYIPFEGQCIEVRCKDLTAPQFGSITSCGTLVGETCDFACQDGYVADGVGSISLVCLENGAWSSDPLECRPCALNTYKDGERTCTPCPVNSHTEDTGQMQDGCVCSDGYEGPAGGPCENIDECLENDGRGKCEDTCKDLDGSYTCSCTRPGYRVDPEDDHKCFPAEQCKNITADEAPRNGGLVCHWWEEENSQFCSTRCNPGYEHATGVNNYETCGPTTKYLWSFKITALDEDPDQDTSDNKMEDCIEAFFPGVTMEPDIYYFTSNCEDLTEPEKEDVKNQFADILNEKGVCKKAETQLCDVKDMGIICGRTFRLRRRDLYGMETIVEETEVKLKTTIIGHEIIKSKAECNATMCEFLNLPQSRCERDCIRVYNRFLKAGVMYAERQLNAIYKDPKQLNDLVMQAANRVFRPAEENNIHTSGTKMDCEPGMEYAEDSCRACRAGSYLNKANMTCVLCPVGSYQNKEGQESCRPCMDGFTNTVPGSRSCQLCKRGWYGAGCKEKCTCVHGICNTYDGECLCNPGYEGVDCSIDIAGCREGKCYPGVECFDVAAPQTGFTCGPCPDGYHGDGYTCSKLITINTALHIHTEL